MRKFVCSISICITVPLNEAVFFSKLNNYIEQRAKTRLRLKTQNSIGLI